MFNLRFAEAHKLNLSIFYIDVVLNLLPYKISQVIFYTKPPVPRFRVRDKISRPNPKRLSSMNTFYLFKYILIIHGIKSLINEGLQK